MNKITRRAAVLATVLGAALFGVALIAAPASAGGTHTGFGFNARDISGFPTGSATLTGGGSFDIADATAHSGGGFRCTATVNQGPLTGCEAGQGVRWDTAALLTGTSFKCTGAASEPLQPIATDEHTVVLHADFYRAGDGNDESFQANMILADHDIAPGVQGMQNVWIQGVGCANANTNFSN
jgi:hypothetical protein